MRTNHVKKALENGETVFGTMVVESRSPSMAQLFATAGFDFMFIDTEHSSYGIETVADMIWASKASDICPIVRVTELDYPFIARTLDLGAGGLMVPRRKTPEEAKEMVQYAKYPPMGERGLSTSPGGHTDFKTYDLPEFMEGSNDNTLLVFQVETAEAIENIEDIVAVPGIDVAMIGPNDLSKSLGVVGELDHPKVQNAIDKVIDACEKHDVAAGLHSGNIEMLQDVMERGMRFITWTTDARILVNSSRDALSKLK